MQGVLAAQFKEIDGEVGLLGEAFVFEIAGADLGGELILADGVADAAPEIGLPGDVKGEGEVGVGSSAGGGGDGGGSGSAGGSGSGGTGGGGAAGDTHAAECAGSPVAGVGGADRDGGEEA